MKEKLSIMTEYPHNNIFVTKRNEQGQAIEYTISDGINDICVINFQNGGRNVEGSTRGIISEELVRIVYDQLSYFAEKFPTDNYNNSMAEVALKFMKLSEARYAARDKAGTLGNNGEDYKQEK